jgi:transcriptional regulator GlxA family with amidase domain
MKTVAIIVFDNFTDIDVFLPWDLFNRVRVKDKSWKVKILGTQTRHTSTSGLSIDTHGMIEESHSADIVFFSSGRGTRQLMRDQEYLKRFALDPERQIICSMCSGALILAGLGLLNNITATTYPSVVEELKAFGVEVEEKALVTHGNIGTAAGCLAFLDLIGWVLDKTAGTEIREDVLASVMPVGKGLECIY